MAMNLEPRLVALEAGLERGALVRIDPTDGAGTDTPLLGGAALPFQYNPETITRTRTGQWDPRAKRKGQRVASPQEVRTRSGQGSSALLAESEQISLKVVFDATEAVLAGRQEATDNGVLPQLAFLELVSAGQQRGRVFDDGTETVQPIKPDELLLVLGTSRFFPVVLTNLSITEQKFLPSLVPLRADVDLKLTVLEPVESAYSTWIDAAFTRLQEKRETAVELAVDGDLAAALDRELRPLLRGQQ